MPVISRFYGMVVKMFFFGSEHNPPHIHVVYGEYVGIIDLQTLAMLQGDLPDKAYRLVKNGRLCTKRSCSKCGSRRISTPYPPLNNLYRRMRYVC